MDASTHLHPYFLVVSGAVWMTGNWKNASAPVILVVTHIHIYISREDTLELISRSEMFPSNCHVLFILIVT